MGKPRSKRKGRSLTSKKVIRALAGVCLVLTAGLAVAACGSGGSGGEENAAGARVYTLSTADDPNRYMFYYPMLHDLVKDPEVKVEIELLPFASAAEAFLNRQYDIVEANWLNAAQGAEKDFNTKIISAGLLNTGLTSIIVPKDSPVKSPSDLKGKKLGIQAQGTIFSTEARALLQEKYGVNASLENGDVQWVEVPEIPTLFRLLQKGDIDAIIGTQLSTYQVVGDPGGPNKILTEVTKEYDAMTGAEATQNSSFITYDDPGIPPKDVEAIQKLFQANTAYFKAHTAEIVDLVVKEEKAEKAYLDWTLENLSVDMGPVNPAQKKMIESGLESAAKLDMISSVPNADSLIFQPGS